MSFINTPLIKEEIINQLKISNLSKTALIQKVYYASRKKFTRRAIEEIIFTNADWDCNLKAHGAHLYSLRSNTADKKKGTKKELPRNLNLNFAINSYMNEIVANLHIVFKGSMNFGMEINLMKSNDKDRFINLFREYIVNASNSELLEVIEFIDISVDGTCN